MADIWDRLEASTSGAISQSKITPKANGNDIWAQLEAATSVGKASAPTPTTTPKPTATPAPTPVVTTSSTPKVEEEDNLFTRLFGNKTNTAAEAAHKARTDVLKEQAEKTSYGEYLRRRFSGGAVEAAEGTVNALGYWQQDIAKSKELEADNAMRAAAATTKNPYAKAAIESRIEDNKAQELVYRPTETWAEFGDKYIAETERKYGDADYGKVGNFLGDVAEGVGGVVTKAPASFVPGLGTLITFASAYGNARQSAQKQGADEKSASFYAFGTAAVELATEKILGFADVSGGGVADEWVTKMIKKLTSSEVAQKAFRVIAGSVIEGAEEFLAELGQRYVNELTINTDDRTLGETAKEGAYNALVGGITGLLTSAAKIISGGDGSVRTPEQKQQIIESAVKQAAAQTNTEIAQKTAENNTPTEGEISRSNGTLENAANVIAENAEAIPDYQGRVSGEAGSAANGGDGLGAANAGFTINEGEQVSTQNKTTTQSKYLTDEEKNILAPGTHERISEAENINRAQQNFYLNSDGEIVNLEHTVEDLLEKELWDSTDQSAAQIAMMETIRRARQNGDYSKAIELGKKIDSAGTAAAQSLQARQKWVGDSGTNIMIAAASAVEGIPSTERNRIMGEVAEYAAEFDEVLNGEVLPKRTRNKQKVDYVDEVDTVLDAKREIEGLKELIRRTAQKRHTTGLWAKNISVMQEWALDRVIKNGDIEFLRTFAANGIVALATDAQKATAGDVITTYRRLAMLSKVSTVMRNLLGNGAMGGVDTLAGNISVPIDMLISKMTKTRSVAADKYFFSEAKRKGSMDALAKSFLEVGLDVDASGQQGRYESSSNRTFKMSGGPIERLFSTWEKLEGYTLVSTDAHSRGGNIAETTRGLQKLADQGKLRAVDGDTDALIADMANDVADYRTFQSDRGLTNLVLDVRRAADNRLPKIGGENGVGVGTLAIPFAKTPINIGLAAVDYSPVGLVQNSTGLVKLLIQAKKGKIDPRQQAELVRGVSRGITGTGLIALATIAAASGFVRTIGNGGDDDDKDKTAFDKMQGENGTQFNLDATLRWLSGEGVTGWQDGDTLISIGFLEPFNAHLATGALIADEWKNSDANVWQKLWNSILLTPEGAFKAVMEMPLMTTLRDAANAYNYSDAENEWGKAADAAAQYAAGQVSSFIPNIVKGAAQGTDKLQRDTYAGDNLWEKTWSNIRASIPGARQTVDAKLDSFGQPVENEGGFLNFLNTNILPGQITHYKEQTGGDILERIYEATGDAKVFPERKAPNTVDGYALDTDAKRQYMQTAGQAHEDMLAALEANRTADKLTTKQMAELLNEIRLRAQNTAKVEAILANGGTVDQSNKDKVVANMSPAEYINWQIADVGAVTPSTYTNEPYWQKFETAAKTLDDDTAVSMMIATNEGAGRKVDAAVKANISLGTAVAYYRAINERTAAGKDPNAEQKAFRISMLGLTEAQEKTLEEIFK